MKQSDYINFLKGIAILGVILVHSPQKIIGLDSSIKELVHFGAFGCQLFFLISGYLIVSSWNRIIKESNKLSISLWLFYRRRFLSIAPIYYLFIILYQLIAYYISEFNLPPFYNICTEPLSIIANFLLLQGLDYNYFNNVVPGGWFIGTIVIFYLIFPILYKCHITLCQFRNPLSPLFLTIIVSVISFIVQFIIMDISGSWIQSRPGSFLYYSIVNQLPCLTLGMAIHDLNFDKTNSKNLLLTSFTIFIITNLLYYGLRFQYWVYSFIPLFLAFTFLFLFFGVKNIYKFKHIHDIKIIDYLENLGRLSFSAYFTNFIGAFIFPWVLQLVLFHYDIVINPLILYLILLIPIFFITFILVPPVDFLITRFKRLI